MVSLASRGGSPFLFGERVMEDIQGVIREVIREFMQAEQAKNEPAHKAELMEERKRREEMERRINALVEENKRSRQMAEEAERSATIRAEACSGWE